MATEKVISLPQPTLKEVAHHHVWELNNIQALLEGATQLLDELTDVDDEREIRCKVDRLLQMAHEKVDAGVQAFMPYV